jgi:ABC-type sugar transport system ATPase subunit
MDEPLRHHRPRGEQPVQDDRDLKAHGTGIIYISHKLDEILRLSDEISVLRDGANVNTWLAADVDNETIIRSMVGREIKEQFPKTYAPITDTILEVKNLTRAGQYEDISFSLRRGEILGFVGLVGSGRTELMHSLFGLTRPDSGKILLEGREVSFKRRGTRSPPASPVTEDARAKACDADERPPQRHAADAAQLRAQGLTPAASREDRRGRALKALSIN